MREARSPETLAFTYALEITDANQKPAEIVPDHMETVVFAQRLMWFSVSAFDLFGVFPDESEGRTGEDADNDDDAKRSHSPNETQDQRPLATARVAAG